MVMLRFGLVREPTNQMAQNQWQKRSPMAEGDKSVSSLDLGNHAPTDTGIDCYSLFRKVHPEVSRYRNACSR